MTSFGLPLARICHLFNSFLLFPPALSFLFAIDRISDKNVNGLSEIQIILILTLIFIYLSEMKTPGAGK